MKKFVTRNKNNIMFIGLLFIISLLLSFIYLISNISYNIISTILIVLNVILVFIISFNYAKGKDQKGLILGLKTGLIYIFILFILAIIFRSFKISSLIYYGILILSSILGSIIAKNKK